VTFYRGASKQTVVLELSPRPLPEVPPTPRALAEAVEKALKVDYAAVSETLQGVSDTEAAHSPAAGEWSAREVLAHLILGERENQSYVANLVNADEPWSEGNPTLVPARISAVVAVCPSLAGLLKLLADSQAETVAMVAALPDALTLRKASFWRLGTGLLQSSYHAQEHSAQIRAAISAARQTVG
jgi:hypothetical protein